MFVVGAGLQPRPTAAIPATRAIDLVFQDQMFREYLVIASQNVYYIMDTNIWIDLAQGKLSCADLTGKTTAGAVVAPFMIVELVRGIVKGGEPRFLQNRAMIECMARCQILELPKVFIFQILWNVLGGVSKVRPHHYSTLLGLVVGSKTLSEFLKKTEEPNSVWKRIGELDSIHEGVLEKELRSLGTLADRASVKTLHVHMARTNQLGGMLPDPDAFEAKFSAAVEFLKSSAIQVRRGANVLKNNRGLYVDNQLFFYLADPEAVVVSNEDFSQEIRKSPQKNRIISYQTFRHL